MDRSRVDQAHRTFVSYIDKSREYYRAKGYETPYRWATNHDAPFTPLAAPLAELRLGVVTTSFPPERAPDRASRRVKAPYAWPADPQPTQMFTDDLYWHKKATHTRDVGSFLPLDHLRDARDAGRLGAVSSRFYGLPTAYSQRRTIVRDAPAVVEMMREDGVDVALLVPL